MTQQEFNKSAMVTANRVLMALSNMVSYGPGKTESHVNWMGLVACIDFLSSWTIDAIHADVDKERWDMVRELLHALCALLKVHKENDRAPSLVEYMQVVRAAAVVLEHCSIVRES